MAWKAGRMEGQGQRQLSEVQVINRAVCPSHTWGLMSPDFKCVEQMVQSPERTSQKKAKAMSAVSISSSRTGSGTVLMVF